MKKAFKIVFMSCIASYVLILHFFAHMVFGFAKHKNSRFNGMKRNFLFLNEWMDKKRKNPLKLAESLSKFRTGRIAIYGAGELGIQLYKELRINGIEVLCFIDRAKMEVGAKAPVYSLQDALPEIDTVIISVVHSQEKIRESILDKIKCDILFLEELI